MNHDSMLESMLGNNGTEIIDADLDLFFVGEGNRDCFKYNCNKHVEQDEKFDFIDDHDRFVKDKCDVSDEKSIIDLYKSVKKSVFDKFGYLKIKSSKFGSVVMSEEDLLMDEYDYIIINNIKDNISDQCVIKSVAELVALWEMSIKEFIFSNQCCPLCNSYNGKIMSVKDAIQTLVGGSNISHKYCSFDIIPVIRRDCISLYDYDVIKNITVEEFEHDGKVVTNFPKELDRYLVQLIDKVDKDKITFMNINDYYMNHTLEVVDNPMELCLLDIEGDLIVHNGYQNGFGPVDYLRCYVDHIEGLKNGGNFPNDDDIKDCEVFFISGRKVIKHKNSYWDMETKERVM